MSWPGHIWRILIGDNLASVVKTTHHSGLPLIYVAILVYTDCIILFHLDVFVHLNLDYGMHSNA